MFQMSSSRMALLALHILFYAGFAIARSLFVPLPVLPALTLGAVLIWISVVDADRMEIPDLAAAALVLTGLLFTYLADLNIINHLIAGLLWAGLFGAVGVGYTKLRGWEGLGFGDVKLIAGIGLWLGLTGTTVVVFASALAGIITVIASGLMRGTSFSQIGQTAVAFGPFLCLSAWVVWLF